MIVNEENIKKYIVIGTIIFVIVLVIFLVLISWKKEPENKAVVYSFTNTATDRGSFKSISSSIPKSVPTQKNLLEKMRSFSGYSDDNFSFSYNDQLGKFLLVKKTDKADAAFLKWADTNGFSDLITNRYGKDVYSHYILERTLDSGFTNNSLDSLSKSEQTNLEEVQKTLPIDEKKFSVDYSDEFQSYIIQKKTDDADKDISDWVHKNNLDGVAANGDIFIVTNKPATKLKQELSQNFNAEQQRLTQPNISSQLTTTYDILKDIYFTDNHSVITRRDSPDSTPSSSPGQCLPFKDQDITALITSYGLPAPVADGTKGYNQLIAKINANEKAKWSVQQLLSAEEQYSSKNPESHGLPKLNRYLTTAWLWYENVEWPDFYSVNCDDTTSLSRVSSLCSSGNFQIAGYQATTRRRDYLNVFNFLYNENDLRTVLQTTLDNSDKGISERFNYNSSTEQSGLVQNYKSQISTATMDDISPNSNFFDPRTQFFTLLLGKDPKMVVGLNSFAVSDDDLIAQLKKGPDYCAYGSKYYCGLPQTLSNMIQALYMIDKNISTAGCETAQAPPAAGPAEAANCPPASTKVLAPNATERHLDWSDSCIKPSMIVIHWSGSWTPAEVTFDTLNERQLGCQLATDGKKHLQTLNMYSTAVERAACVLDYNDYSINNEISGVDFDDVYPNPSNPHYNELMSSTQKAITSTCWQMKQYGIGVDQVFGHRDLNPGRKIDPGAAYIKYFKDRLRKECR